MKIKNINGCLPRTCHCPSWLEHWRRFGGGGASFCPVAGCIEACTVGVHVQKDGDPKKTWYIVPLCARHELNPGPLDILSFTRLVPADLSLTCGRE